MPSCVLSRQKIYAHCRAIFLKGDIFASQCLRESDDIRLHRSQLAQFFHRYEKYEWGGMTAAGLPIELTRRRHISANSSTIMICQPNDRRFDDTHSHWRHTLGTIAESHPDAHVVSFHYTPAATENENDWACLTARLRNRRHGCRAIVHDEWTI